MSKMVGSRKEKTIDDSVIQKQLPLRRERYTERQSTLTTFV